MSPDFQRGQRAGQPPNRGNYSPPQGSAPSAGTETIAMPKASMVRYFVDDGRKALDPRLVGPAAEELAQKAANVPASQIRRFYGDMLALERRLATGTDIPAEAVQAHMALLKAKAAYSFKRAERRQEQFPRELLQFFVDHAAAVRDRKDFDAFRRVFEAVIAYHKFYEPKRNRD
jgi:CRISPR-associated protein Csm2